MLKKNHLHGTLNITRYRLLYLEMFCLIFPATNMATVVCLFKELRRRTAEKNIAFLSL